MNLYENLGYLVLGSRFRRLSEAFLSEVNLAYRKAGIDFDAGWFPAFYLLSDKYQSISIQELSEESGMTHSAASQLVARLKKEELVTTAACNDDGRRQMVQMSEKGKDLLQQILPVWDALTQAMNELITEDTGCYQLLQVITSFEGTFNTVKLSDKINEKLTGKQNKENA